jgi:hypothetical protein
VDSISVSNVPAELKAELLKDAQARECTVSDAAGSALSSYFGIEYRLSGRRTNGATLANVLGVRAPERLVTAVWSASRAWKMTQSQVVIRVLSSHYGLRYVPKRRGAR